MPIYLDNKTKTYYCSFYYYDWQGQNKRKVKRGFKLAREAKAYEADFLSKLASDCSIKFKELRNQYLEYCHTKKLKPTTISNKTFLIGKHFAPFFDNFSVNQITPVIINKWQSEFLSNDQCYSDTYARTVNNLLAAIFHYAMKIYGLKSNPVKILDNIGKAKTNRLDFWTVEEFELFLKTLQDKKLNQAAKVKRLVDDYPLAVAFKILFYCGLRKGELLALTVSDFDYNNRTIRINKNYKRLNGEDLIMSTKTTKSNRVITIPESLNLILYDFINKLYEPTPETRIFHMLSASNMHRTMHTTAKLAGLKEIRIHDLRHSCCSLLFNLGCTPLEVKNYLGHENIKTTLDIYAHLYPEKIDEIANKLNNVAKQYQDSIIVPPSQK